ncbi:SDR family oxidoreductase [Marinomonas mediterranea]|jgi:Dehydrogenases with different specificities (related to short-chain alcohol dehydrogenases)|uniref:3-oxoacyl-(Acyl-carrier-protein) reductase n=1 Tax=Marinomonas mediterranea (strain ATCC 700492 / JCM 21426 / NBRC 103028 / MMB-1) TaxID=717774 RepID=F2JXT3_MARM1|nr:SDR family oxidoreductase [Marinomonas mediterranea]ADZ93081.1 3-oxoacyl-(acyl-carrier-protein) reductase [Marinomonas mediterranea MMB-1]WCN10987.1 SDR family oxidoreductase [Marinomonas mediterranea]WCN15049.1 SDR family oxidoreductase [Marinomonas mediterranea]WCN19093.1 SDR family oxidoreductase [Marinomonas mediterranea MMB-1]
MKNTYTLITGGTSGIGFETAKQLIQEGKQVIITGQNEQRVHQAAQTLGCRGIVADSANLPSIYRLAEQLNNESISLTGLVLNAGIFIPESLEQTSEEAYDQTMSINTKGPLFTLKTLLPLLSNPSSVVFVSSIVVDKGFEACATYAASKAAGEAFVRVANIELASKGIRINTIRPGVTATPIQDKAGMTSKDTDALFESLKSMPLGRALNPPDHAGAISFLLSDASIAMRNAIIQIDGGYCL